jgi:hypothetical protein
MSRATTKFFLEAMESLADLLPAPESLDVTIEVLDESFGDQLEADRLPWHALVYDTRRDEIELSVGGRDRRLPVVFRHSISGPTGVWLEQEDGLPVAVDDRIEGQCENNRPVPSARRPRHRRRCRDIITIALIEPQPMGKGWRHGGLEPMVMRYNAQVIRGES